MKDLKESLQRCAPGGMVNTKHIDFFLQKVSSFNLQPTSKFEHIQSLIIKASMDNTNNMWDSVVDELNIFTAP